MENAPKATSSDQPFPRKKRSNDPLSQKVRKLRKKAEGRAFVRQNVERYVLIITMVVVLFLLIFLSVSLMADIECDVCLIVATAIALIAIMIWSVTRLNEFFAVKNYRSLRREQKHRERSKS
jgi:hypothetical protein